MKNRIDACFEKLKAENKKALVTFITAGDPDMDTTEKCVLEMYKNGSDIIEIGVPFSDPIAEGATIQKASLRSLNGGTNLDKIFDLVRKLRTQTDKPMLLMMYINTIFKFGTAKFFELCKETQIDGVIVPDMPFEEREELEGEAEKNGIYTIFLVAPTSHERVKMIAEKSKGFLYVVSSLGVTGMRSEIKTDIKSIVETIRKYTDIPVAVAPIRNNDHCPCCIGFGISNPEQAKKMSQYADGVIMGSAVVKIVEEHGKDAPEYVGKFIKSVREGMDN